MTDPFRKLRILVVHNYYQNPGGEDSIFSGERDLLRRFGHEVTEYTDTNLRIGSIGRPELALQTIWSQESYRQIIKVLQEKQPNIVHFHNTFVVISPSAYYACKRLGIPVVQTIQNYRLLCPSANFLRNGRACEDCLGKTPPWPAILHRCYRNSRIQTTVIAGMLSYHRWRRTWCTQVDAFVPPTEFLRNKLIRGGIPPEKIFVKANALYPDPGQRDVEGQSMLYIGRFSPEKGVQILTQAWQSLPDIPIKYIGQGPLKEDIRRSLKTPPAELLGWLKHEEVIHQIKNAFAIFIPSTCYEGFPMAIPEAFACGVPIIASRLGAMAEIIEDGRTGLLFHPGSADDLAIKARWAWTHPREMAAMGREARKVYEEKFSGERNYRVLMGIYDNVIHRGLRVKS